MLEHASGIIGFPLRLLARENYDRIVAVRGAGARGARHGRGAHHPAQPVLLDLHRRGHAARPARRTSWRSTRSSSPPTASAATSSPTASCTRAGGSETWLIGAETIRPLLRQAPARRRVHEPAAAVDAALRGAEAARACRARTAVVAFSVRELYEVAERLRRERGGAAVVFGALSPRTRNAQVGALPGGRGRLPGRDRRDRHGPEPRHRPRGLHRPHRSSTARDPRALTPAEVAQIAGRAGRHVQDGRFGRAPSSARWKRSSWMRSKATASGLSTPSTGGTHDLDFRSPLALLGSLECEPPHPGLRALRQADDQRAFAALAADPETSGLAPSPSGAPPLGRLPGARLPGVADRRPHSAAGRAVPPLSRPARACRRGLLAAQVRSWTGPKATLETLLAPHRLDPDLDLHLPPLRLAADARHWQERTRAVEDRLSDGCTSGSPSSSWTGAP